MILLLNGAFGIGKTSVARHVVRRLPEAILVDPEKIGVPLRWGARIAGRTVDDFQDLRLWRRLTITAIRAARVLARNVVVPMAFSNRSYLDEIHGGVTVADASVLHICLVAPLDVVAGRLRARGADPARHSWEFRRAAECCEAHRDPVFAMHVETAGRTIEQVADDVLILIHEGRDD